MKDKYVTIRVPADTENSGISGMALTDTKIPRK